MDEIIDGIREVLSASGNQVIADLLVDANHEISESSAYGTRLYSTISTFVITSNPKNIALLNGLSVTEKEKIKEAAILFYPIQDNSPEIREIIFKAVPKKSTLKVKEKKSRSDETIIGSASSIGKTFCLIVAIENYNENADFPKVDYAEKDATDLIETFKMLGYDTSNFISLINNKATKSAIISKIKFISQSAEKNDRIVFYFAGHGFYEGGKNLLAPVDAVKLDKIDTCVSIDQILSYLTSSHCLHNLLFLDCCHSGFSIGTDERDGIDSFAADALIYQFRDEEFCIGFASCKSNQKSNSHAKLKNGVWSHFLNKALRGDAEGIYDGDILFSDKLQSYLKEQTYQFVKMNTEKKKDQTPIKFGTETDKFIIADLTAIFEEKRKNKTTPEISISAVTLSNEDSGNIKNLPDFQKNFHKVPTFISSTTKQFVISKGAKLISEEINSISTLIKEHLKYKRIELIATIDEGSGSIVTPDFDYHLTLEQSLTKPSEYSLIRKLENFKKSEIVNSIEFNLIFDRHFNKLEFELSNEMEIEKVIDKIEALPENSGLRVDFSPSDLSSCKIIFDDSKIEVNIYKRSLSIETDYPTSPGKLIELFKESRKVILSHNMLTLLE